MLIEQPRSSCPNLVAAHGRRKVGPRVTITVEAEDMY